MPRNQADAQADKKMRVHLNPMEIHDGWIENLKAERRTQIM